MTSIVQSSLNSSLTKHHLVFIKNTKFELPPLVIIIFRPIITDRKFRVKISIFQSDDGYNIDAMRFLLICPI
jgi:hypothetical protein